MGIASRRKRSVLPVGRTSRATIRTCRASAELHVRRLSMSNTTLYHGMRWSVVSFNPAKNTPLTHQPHRFIQEVLVHWFQAGYDRAQFYINNGGENRDVDNTSWGSDDGDKHAL